MARAIPLMPAELHDRQIRSSAIRAALVGGVLVASFAAVAVQLVRLAASGQDGVRLAAAAPLTTSFSRPDIVDRNGRLLATDVAVPSLFADPKHIASVDETLERLSTLLPGIDTPDMRTLLSDKSRRFVWIKRRLSTGLAQKIHDLGQPGLAFRFEPARSYPRGRLAGHLLGYVNIDNKAVNGIERYIDDQVGIVQVPAARVNTNPPVRLSIDTAVQYALEEELADAMKRFHTSGVSGVVMDSNTGEVRAAASLPGVDPALTNEVLAKSRINRFGDDVFELGSVFKVVTLAMALDAGVAKPSSIVDVVTPLTVGRFKIEDFHPSRRPLSVTEVFLHSSNVGAGRLALALGAKAHRKWLDAFHLTSTLSTEAGVIAEPKLPNRLGKAANITIAYGHGIAVAPLQFLAAAAATVNGGIWVQPTFLERPGAALAEPAGKRILKARTSDEMRKMMRLNVTSPEGSGHRADVPGYEVGGKTGTADWARNGVYDGKAVINSFFAAFPIHAPRYVVLVTLFDPKREKSGRFRSMRTAGLNAAPTAGRVIARVAPLLGVVPRSK